MHPRALGPHRDGPQRQRSPVEVAAADARGGRQKGLEDLPRREEGGPRRVELVVPRTHLVDVEPGAHHVRVGHPLFGKDLLQLQEDGRRLFAARRRKVGRQHACRQQIDRVVVLEDVRDHTPRARDLPQRPCVRRAERQRDRGEAPLGTAQTERGHRCLRARTHFVRRPPQEHGFLLNHAVSIPQQLAVRQSGPVAPPKKSTETPLTKNAKDV